MKFKKGDKVRVKDFTRKRNWWGRTFKSIEFRKKFIGTVCEITDIDCSGIPYELDFAWWWKASDFEPVNSRNKPKLTKSSKIKAKAGLKKGEVGVKELLTAIRLYCEGDCMNWTSEKPKDCKLTNCHLWEFRI